MQKPTSHVEATPIRVTIVTLDGHLGGICDRVQQQLEQEVPGLQFSMHPASEWANDEDALKRCEAAIGQADILLTSMLFLDAHVQAVLPALQARAPQCDAFVGVMSGAEIVKLTRMGSLNMSGPLKGPVAMLRKLRGSKKPGASNASSQMALLRRLPRILKFIPGKAQDLRAYFLTMQCWLAGSEENIASLVRLLVHRYASDERVALRDMIAESAPVDYPDTGLYHPALARRVTTCPNDLPAPADCRATIGLLLMRSYVLAGNTKHYDEVIRSFEARGLRVLPAFATGLDARPVIDAFFRKDGESLIDCLVSLTGFSLVGGPAYSDSVAAGKALEALDVPYLAAHPSEFQTLSQWHEGGQGLTPIEATMMVAIPELDGATGPMLFAGHESTGKTGKGDEREMRPVDERIDTLAERVGHLVSLRHEPRHSRKLGIVLFNFPPNAGATGTAAYLAVFNSLFNVLTRLKREGYDVEVPASEDELREQILGGNSERYGTDANVLAVVPTDEHVRQTPWLEEVEKHWGPAPGKLMTNGQGLFVLGARFGNVTVGIQPGFGIEGDPMRLLYEGGFAPTHAFCAFYQHLRNTVDVDALLHFGTHGALEFMPGKQTGMSGECWPDRLIGDTPNFYLYAANNPSEGAIAKRRSAATLISYLTPTVTEAGLYRGLADLRSSIQQWHRLPSQHSEEAGELIDLLRQQCGELDVQFEDEHDGGLDWQHGRVADTISRLQRMLDDYEGTLIPQGMHVIGEAPSVAERLDLLHAFQNSTEAAATREAVAAVLEAHDAGTFTEMAWEKPAAASADDGDADQRRADAPVPGEPWQNVVARMNGHLKSDAELDGIVHALDAGFVKPAPGGDVLRNPKTLPTGRNIHGFDPFRLPTRFAQRCGERHADLLIERHLADSGALPRSVAFVLWGTDNLKNEGIPIAQVMALMGIRARVDGFGKVCGAELISLEELGRPRVDVLVTLSGIFRDLLPLQTRLLAEGALLAARADEPLSHNPIREHTLAYQRTHGCDFETAALRVYSNAEGAYGANVNQLIDSGAWSDEGELASTYGNRKCFAYGVDGSPVKQTAMLESALGDVDLTYQNLESVELGVTSLDYYFDTLGGINSMIKKARGKAVPTYIGDQTRGGGSVRSLKEQVALETRTRMLNPKWYEGMLKHGYEGVRSIEASVTNTLGWSATTGQVSPWVYRQLAETFVLDKTMRDRLAELNPAASARVANRLLEAHERNYWSPSEDVLQALSDAGDELEDRLEGVYTGAAA